MPANDADDLRRRALMVMPGGVSSNVRALEQEPPLFIARASGAHVWDNSGRRTSTMSADMARSRWAMGRRA